MAIIAPPAPPMPSAAQDQPNARIHFRIQQIFWSTVTIIVTCWLWTIHPIIGISALFLAKHVLVAILAAGLKLPDDNPEER